MKGGESHGPNLSVQSFTDGTSMSPRFFGSSSPVIKDCRGKVLSLILKHFQSLFGLDLGQSVESNITAQPNELLWRYFVLDFLINNFIIAPLVVATWRGSWGGIKALLAHVEYLKVSY